MTIKNKLLLGLFIILQGVDYLLTKVAVSSGIREYNPIVNKLVSNTAIWWGFKFGLTIIVLYVIIELLYRRRTVGEVILSLCTLSLVGITIGNIIVMR